MRTARHIACLAALAAALDPEALPQTDPNAACRRAAELHRAGKLEQAVPAYQECVKAHPGVAELLSDFGAALAGLGRYTDAIAQYREALRIAPGNPAVERNLALAYYKSGEIAKAAAELQALHAQSPDDMQVTLLLADSDLQMGEFQRVIELLEPTAAEHRSDRAFSYLLGTALIRGGRVSDGQALVDGILRDGSSAEARFLLGTAAFVEQDYPRAVQELAKAIELDPALPSLHSYYGQALLLTGDADGADRAFRTELVTNPKDYESNLGLGRILARRGHAADAIPYLERAVKLRPTAFEPKLDLGTAYLAAGEAREARRILEEAIRERADVADAHTALAKAYSELHLAKDSERERALAENLRAKSNGKENYGLLAAGAAAPDFTLPLRGSNAVFHLAEAVEQQPLILMFGSYTCPKFRFDAPALKGLYERYGGQTRFLMVYVQEAHTSENWQSTVNEREGVDLPPAKTFEQKLDHAATCVRKLDLPFPVAIDRMDRKVERVYGGWPSAVYIVDRKGRITWSSRLGEVELSREELERQIREAIGRSK